MFASGAFANPHTFCIIDYTTNGVLVRYRDPVQRRRKLVEGPSIDLGAISKFVFEHIASQEDEFNPEKSERLDKMKEMLGSAFPAEGGFAEEWILMEKTIFCPRKEDIPDAIAKAHEAYLTIIALVKEGKNLVHMSPVM